MLKKRREGGEGVKEVCFALSSTTSTLTSTSPTPLAATSGTNFAHFAESLLSKNLAPLMSASGAVVGGGSSTPSPLIDPTVSSPLWGQHQLDDPWAITMMCTPSASATSEEQCVHQYLADDAAIGVDMVVIDEDERATQARARDRILMILRSMSPLGEEEEEEAEETRRATDAIISWSPNEEEEEHFPICRSPMDYWEYSSNSVED
jgi:hypothetical protein